MSYVAEGKVLEVGTTTQVSDRFKKREVILEIDDGHRPQTCAFEFHQDKVGELDGIRTSDVIRVEFDLRGRQWTNPKTGEVRTFNTLAAWRLEKLTGALPETPLPDGSEDDIPF